MQIGRRWSVGAAAPTDLPSTVIDAIAAEEAELARLGADTVAWRWTLTYLEGSPVVELDDGTRITLVGGAATTTRED